MEIKHQAFLHWLGTLILKREKEAPGQPVDIPGGLDLLEDAFRSGWSWGKNLAQEEEEAS